jgi:protein ATS1
MSRSIFACGSNGAGQLALGHIDDVSAFAQCKFDPSCGEIVDVHDLVSSASHSLLLVTTSDGDKKLLGAGTNTHNQLGPQCALKEGQVPATTFRPVSLRRFADLTDEWVPTKIAATWTTTFVVYERSESEGVKVVACGSNDFGELGVAPGSACGPVVVVDLGLQNGECIELLCGGQRHVVAVITQGDGNTQRVVGWGAARRGELSATPLPAAPVSAKGKGKAPARPSTLPPTSINLAIPPHCRITDISLGASHSLALLSNGRVLAWGNDGKGQITGLDSVSNVHQLGATWGGSYLLADDGLRSQGSNTHSQLLREADRPDRALVPLDAKPTSLCTGTEHVLVLAKDPSATSFTPDALYAGGWNEHGNLGLGDTDDRSRLVQVPKIEGQGRILGMWTGCAASWIWMFAAQS